jgi:hypothetical protein
MSRAVLQGKDYLAICNQGDLPELKHRTSYVYRLDEECDSAIKAEL